MGTQLWLLVELLSVIRLPVLRGSCTYPLTVAQFVKLPPGIITITLMLVVCPGVSETGLACVQLKAAGPVKLQLHPVVGGPVKLTAGEGTGFIKSCTLRSP